MDIVRLTEARESYVADINGLLSQLRSDPSEHKGSLIDLHTIVADKNVAFIVAVDGEKIVGMATLYMITKIGKRGGYVEDVVVDGNYRGQGLGEKLMQKLLEVARRENLKQLYLTTRPDRVAAHKLYEKLGFTQQQTDVYRMKI
ncbi:GNAT family N-acetyltransferase [Candidatus Parcubacteria bacterium]|nr:MAG: GNAT family N-acetyltransferase [Candidatus Parcubacteria bacterium]